MPTARLAHEATLLNGSAKRDGRFAAEGGSEGGRREEEGDSAKLSGFSGGASNSRRRKEGRKDGKEHDRLNYYSICMQSAQVGCVECRGVRPRVSRQESFKSWHELQNSSFNSGLTAAPSIDRENICPPGLLPFLARSLARCNAGPKAARDKSPSLPLSRMRMRLAKSRKLRLFRRQKQKR